MNKGFAFHCHHDKLVEWVFDFDERVKAIQESKPEEEQAVRLRLFKLIPGDRIPPEIFKLGAAHSKAEAALGEVWAAYREASDKTRAAYDAAEAACNKVLLEHEEYFLELHKELCPDCPWDEDEGIIF